MRILTYYIIGALIGVALVFGAWKVKPTLFSSAPTTITAETAALPSDIADNNARQLDAELAYSRQNAITRAVKDVSPAVVGINVTQVREIRARSPFFDDPFFRQFFPDQIYRQKVENLGSGFLISPDGYVLTNEHVVQGATEIVVTTSAGEKYTAQITGFDYDSDVALLKIEDSDFPYIRFGDSDSALIGEWAIAIGNPFGLFTIHSQPSVSVGVVSATDRDFERNAEGKLYQDMIQTDAAINRGNSGGPLVDAAGELIGMNTMIFTEGGGGSIGLGFAIPSNKLKKVYDELRQRGGLDRDFWIGLQVQDVNRVIAVSLRLPELRGVVVTGVEKGSPVDKAGIQPPDVILGVNGAPIRDSADINRILRNSDLRVGDVVKFDLWRDGKAAKVGMKLEKKG
jgi:serine protease Do